MKIGLLEATAVTLLLFASATAKGANASFAYQGCLLNERGQVLSERNHTIVFRLYNQATGGTNLWSCTKNVLLNESGLFSVELSGNAASGKTLGQIIAENASRSLYIGLTVDSDGAEIEPRQKLLPVPKALWAADSMAAQNNITVSSNLVGSAAADTGNTSAKSLRVTNGMTCKGKLMPGSLQVTGNLSVKDPSSIKGNGAIPVGGIVIWNGTVANIPDGWALCDGRTSNGRKTPNLTDRFILGAGGKYTVDKTGGAATVTLELKHIPPHTHDYKFKGADLALAWKNNNNFYDSTGHYSKNDRTKTTESAGGQNGKTVAHENRPPYFALCYIMRVK
jgi:microcystin-dependent protein